MRVSPVNLSYSNSLNESRKNKVTKNVPQYILHEADLPASEPSLQYHLSLHCCVVLEYS